MDAAAVSYPGFEADLARCTASVERVTATIIAQAAHGHRHRRARGGRQVHRRPRRRRGARLHLPRLRGDVPLRRPGGAAARRRPRRRRRDRRGWPRGLRIELRRRARSSSTARTSATRSASREVTEAASRVSVHPRVREAMVERQRELIAAGRYVAEGRDIGTVVSPDSPLKVFLTASERGAGAAPRRADRRGRRRGARRPARARPRATRPASTAPCARPTTRSRSTRPASPGQVVERIVARPRAGSDDVRCRRLRQLRSVRSMSRPPTVAVVGFPNVGKSTLVNRLAGGREAVTHAEPGVTRDRKRVALRVERRRLRRCSTPAASTSPTRTSWPATSSARPGSAIAEADVVMLVVDARAGVRAGDAELAETLRGAEVPVIVVANKVDRPEDEHLTAELQQARPRRAAGGLGHPRPRHRRPARPRGRAARRARPSRRADEDAVRVAVIGRPNAGKSSLVNAFLGSDRVIVSDRAGTTRDAIDTELEVDGRPVVLVDTAGLRRRSKVAGTVDYYAQLRSERAVERADVAIVVCDAGDGRHRRGPAGRRAGDAGRLRDPARAQQVGRDPHRHRRRPRPGRPEAAPAPGGDHLLGDPRPQRRQPAAQGAGARRPRRRADPDPRAQPLRRRRRRQDAAALAPRPSPAPLLLGPGRRAPAADRDPGQRPQADHPRLGLPPREPHARDLRRSRACRW